MNTTSSKLLCLILTIFGLGLITFQVGNDDQPLVAAHPQINSKAYFEDPVEEAGEIWSPNENSTIRDKTRFYFRRCMIYRYERKCVSDGSGISKNGKPCSEDILKDLLYNITEVLDHLKISYYTIFGTLLGAERSQRFIPWTIDVDLVVNATMYYDIVELARPYLARRGIAIWRDDGTGWPTIKACISKQSEKYARFRRTFNPNTGADWTYEFPFVDMNREIPSEKGGKLIEIESGGKCRYHPSDLHPPTKVKILDRYFNAPAKPKEVLKIVYGPTWLEPPPEIERNGHGDWSKTCQNEWSRS